MYSETDFFPASPFRGDFFEDALGDSLLGDSFLGDPFLEGLGASTGTCFFKDSLRGSFWGRAPFDSIFTGFVSLGVAAEGAGEKEAEEKRGGAFVSFPPKGDAAEMGVEGTGDEKEKGVLADVVANAGVVVGNTGAGVVVGNACVVGNAFVGAEAGKLKVIPKGASTFGGGSAASFFAASGCAPNVLPAGVKEEVGVEEDIKEVVGAEAGKLKVIPKGASTFGGGSAASFFAASGCAPKENGLSFFVGAATKEGGEEMSLDAEVAFVGWVIWG